VSIDEDRLHAFLNKAVGDLGAAFSGVRSMIILVKSLA
jgi:hypothetical protein